MQITGRSRYELFLELEKPELEPLPTERFSISRWKKARVHIDYHVEVKKSYYSVPYRFIGKQVEVKYNDRIVAIYYDCKRIAGSGRPGCCPAFSQDPYQGREKDHNLA